MPSIERTKTKSGKPRWRVKSEKTLPDGSRVHAPSKTFDNYADAKAEAAKRELQGGTTGKGTLGRYLHDWLAYQEQMGLIRPVTAAKYRPIIEDVSAHIGSVALAKVDVDHVEFWLGKLRQRGVADSSMRTYKATLSSALKDALLQKKVSHNPCTIARIAPNKDTQERVVLPLSQMREFLTLLDLTKHGPVYRLAAATGMRRGELCGLTWGNVDFERQELHVRQVVTNINRKGLVVGPPKSKSGVRTIPLSDTALRLLREAKLRSGGATYVFPGPNGSPRSPSAVSSAGQRAKVQLGLPESFSPVHGCRHLFATEALRAGVNPRTLQTLLGHAKIEETLMYVKPDDSDRRSAVLALEGLL